MKAILTTIILSGLGASYFFKSGELASIFILLLIFAIKLKR